MRDAALAALIDEAMGPFPRGLGGEEINGVDLVMLDADIMGVASHYDMNSRTLTVEHHDDLVKLLGDLDHIYGALPTDASRQYFDRARAVGRYLLDKRAPA